MQEKQILRKFKEVVGQYCAINQFVELTKRCFISEHQEEIANRDSFISLATRYSVALTSYDSAAMVSLISKSYIVNIHLCFETFLKEVCTLARKYGQGNFTEKTKELSWLACAVNNIIRTKLPDDMQALFDLCEYYRLVRNSAVHDLCDIDEHTQDFNRLKKHDYKTDAKFKRLEAPNAYDQISFDDFVMFARSSIELATYLFESIEYDYEKIVVAAPKSTQSKWRKYVEQRRCDAIRRYVEYNFRIDASFEAQLPDLSRLFTAQ